MLYVPGVLITLTLWLVLSYELITPLRAVNPIITLGPSFWGGGGFGSFGLQLYASVCVCIYTNRQHPHTTTQTFTPTSLPLPLSLYAGLGSPGVYFTLKFTTPPP